MSFKIEKVNSLLAQEISYILNKKMRDDGLGFVTVTAVDCSKDLRNARIWVSILDANKEKNFKILKDNIREIQSELIRRVDMKYCPKIHFRLDNSQENLSKIDKLLADEKKKLEDH
jgi:ribosome-binding factor A